MIIGLIFIVLIIIVAYYFYNKDRVTKLQEAIEETNITIDELELCDNLIASIKEVSSGDFCALLELHKFAWRIGIQPKSLGTNINGRFRRSIESLTFDDIYLGGFDALIIQPVSEWMKDTEPIGENAYGRDKNISHCDQIWHQYKSILVGSIGSYKQVLYHNLNN